MLTDETITLRDTERRELALITEMEQSEAYSFVIPYSLPRHQDEFEKPAIVYKSIYRDDKIIGFVILTLDPDGRSVEFRRIVVSVPGHGYGKHGLPQARNRSGHLREFPQCSRDSSTVGPVRYRSNWQGVSK